MDNSIKEYDEYDRLIYWKDNNYEAFYEYDINNYISKFTEIINDKEISLYEYIYDENGVILLSEYTYMENNIILYHRIIRYIHNENNIISYDIKED